MRRLLQVVLALGVLLSGPVAWAQTSSGIAGLAHDTTGAVLPGVTVEAASPALIEKVRTVVTDAVGRYNIVDLRPGTYTVTFTLPGFSTFKREGIELTTGFTATVNGEMRVGSLEETVTVTGATPTVDVQNVRTQQVLRTETMNQLPSGAKNLMSYAALTLGAIPSSAGRNDVGGDKGEQATGIVLHGGRGDDGRTNWDGMNTNVFFGNGGGQQRTYYFNTVAVQEVAVDTGGAMVETETGGANVNMVPREGGNRFSLYGIANYTNKDFSAKAVPDDLKRERNIADQSSLKQIYDYGIGVGGPLKRDKLWFYGTTRWWGADNYAANNYFDKDTNPYTYTPDLGRQAYSSQYYVDSSFRATWQAASKHKISHEVHLQHGCSCDLSLGAGALASPEASTDYNYGPQILNQTKWSFTATNKLLIQVGTSFLRQEVNFVDGVEANANKFTGAGTAVFPGSGAFSILESTGVPGGAPGGYRYGGLAGNFLVYGENDDNNNFNQRASVSYVTGSHALKAGFESIQGHYDFYAMQHNVEQVNYTFRGGSPASLTQLAGPFQSRTRLTGQGLFAQDQWTVGKVTLSGGARYDHFAGRTLAQDIPAGRFRPAFHVDEVKNLPNFQDWQVRIGAAYDLFGNGKTAVKGSFGKYLAGQGGVLSFRGFAPSVAIVTQSPRSWNDQLFGATDPRSGNFVPDCNLNDLKANGECGDIQNPLFGQPASAQTLADDARKGWGNREFNYQWNVQVQHELRPGLGVSVGYFHTQWENMLVYHNTRVTPADFSTYCVTAPTDARLGATSGQQVCGFYELTPTGVAKGAAFELTRGENFGDLKDYYNGVDIGFNARWKRGAYASGGVSVGRQVADNCALNDRPDVTPVAFPLNFNVITNPNSRYPRNDQFCKVAPPWWSGVGSQVKLQVVYPLPYDIVVSGAYKHLPGIPVNSDLVLTTAQLAPLLGRPSTAPGTATQAIIPVGSGDANTAGGATGTVFDQRLNQVDLRLSKIVRLGKNRVQGMLDIYNVFNARTPQGIVTTYSSVFLRPTSLLGGRLFKFGVQFDL
jgi:hypothetical protein